MSELYIGIAAYNEAANIHDCLKYLETSLAESKLKNKTRLFICLNGCDDNTENILKELKNNFICPLKILKTKKGKLNAHKEILKNIPEKSKILFIDADVLVPSKTIVKLLQKLSQDKNIKIVSAYPYTIKQPYIKNWKKIKYSVLNIKRIYPKIEISKNDVSSFHKTHDKFIQKSRIYFHGRCFLLRNKSIYEFPQKDSMIRGDDTYLSLNTLKKYPKNSIKVLYDSPVYSHPVYSITEYLKVWYRIRKDIDIIKTEHPEFQEIIEKTRMKLNWSYVLFKLPPEFKLYAILFFILKQYESITYRILKYQLNIDSLWTYKSKTRLFE